VGDVSWQLFCSRVAAEFIDGGSKSLDQPLGIVAAGQRLISAMRSAG
jgi:hypothetical protein